MSVSPLYFEYLDRFGAAISLREFRSTANRADAIVLRHDVDHDLDLALEVAHHEHARGLRATYFLLHTAPYWGDQHFAVKCRQLEAYGHEVALHVNVLTEWMSGEIDDVNARLGDLLTQLRDAGVTVSGVSAHGDPACYAHGFINYWMWRELRGDDPATSEQGMSAEGIRVEEPRWQVPYPAVHRLRRADGATFDLWSSSLAAHGLEYDAAHVQTDHYWSDSGGSWSRTDDPRTAEVSSGTHQVLMHPYWWRGLQRRVYVLSTARAGSKWLAGFVDTATSATGRHEFALNHRREGADMVPDKQTHEDYVGLVEDRERATRLLREATANARTLRGDLLEANVYLEPFLPQLQALDPDATLIHLHRDGRDVVRSILNRGWYDTPDDRRHRAVPIPRWDRLSQLERACWYYRFTCEQIAPHAAGRVSFERMVTDLAYLTEVLADLNIVVHPLLAQAIFDTPVNANTATSIPPFDEWPARMQRTFNKVCGPIQATLGYGAAPAADPPVAADDEPADRQPTLLADVSGAAVATLLQESSLVACAITPDGLGITPTIKKNNTHAVLAKGTWAKVPADAGFPCRPDVYFRCRIEAQLSPGMKARVFVLFCDQSGQAIRRHQAWTLRSERQIHEFSFASAVGATHAAVALHMGNESPDQVMRLVSFHLESIPFAPGYRSARVLAAADHDVAETEQSTPPPPHDPFGSTEALAARYAVPPKPEREPAALFPLAWYETFLREIKSRGIEVLTYRDLFKDSDDWDYRDHYRREFRTWHEQVRDPERTYLLIQHDIDDRPMFTERMIAMEAAYGIRSNIFMFKDRFWHDDPKPSYPIDHGFFAAAERHGFVIGYHQNAMQHAGHDVALAQERFRSDMAFLSSRYRIEFMVPHGGRGREVDGQMLHNVDLPMPPELEGRLRWVYNRYSATFTGRFSDGGLVRSTDPERLAKSNLVTFLDRLRPGTRNFCLVHPQWWGHHVAPAWNPKLAEEAWYQEVVRTHAPAVMSGSPDDLIPQPPKRTVHQ